MHSGFVVPYVWEIVVWKKSNKFWRLLLSSILYIELMEFKKSRQIILTGIHAFSIWLNWERYHLLHLSWMCTPWKKSDDSSSHSWAFFCKMLHKVNRRFLRFSNYEHWKKLYRNSLKSRYWNTYLCYYSSCPKIVFYRLKKIFNTFLFKWEQDEIISNKFN